LIFPESNAPDIDVTVCGTPSLLVQVTVVPFEISTISGTKVELLIATLTGVGVVGTGTGVVGTGTGVVGTGVCCAGCVVVVVVHPLINPTLTVKKIPFVGNVYYFGRKTNLTVTKN
jgi:hypothetical protein